MIRIVSIRKAILAGAAGAIAWEIVLRLLLLGGIPVVDIVRMLGLVAVPGGAAWAWWTAGMVLHTVVGVIWAVFYAYFFWSVLAWRPIWQGLVFTLAPTVLAITVVYPQLYVMQSSQSVLAIDPWRLLTQISWGERAGLLLGHLIYGAVLGALYTHPVGYPVDRAPRLPAPVRRKRPASRRAPQRAESAFIFATGIECSYPTIEGGRWDIGLSQPLGNVNPVGLFDLNRDPRAVAQAYKHLIQAFGGEPQYRDCPELKALLQ